MTMIRRNGRGMTTGTLMTRNKSSGLTMTIVTILVVLVGLFSSCSVGAENVAVEQPTVPVYSVTYTDRDPALHLMKYQLEGDGSTHSTWVYIEPNVTTFYPPHQPLPAQTKVTMKFTGFSGKFINLSNQRLAFHWEEREGGKKHLMRIHGPFSATGTATFPTHRFVYTPEHDPDTIIHRFVVKQYPDNIHVYDPYLVPGDAQQTEKNLRQALSIEERGRYNQWRNTLAFHEQYLAMTGRSYLANYLRAPPGHFMWRADYFGQEHWVATPQVQFHSLPPKDKMEPILTQPIARRRQYEESSNRSKKNRVLDEFRQEDSFLNLTLRVLSCAPRVFEIPNFLSEVEYSHIMELAKTLDLKLSSTGDVIKGEKSAVSEDSRRTRTSFNSWLARESSPVVDIIYRRAADLLRIDEALLRYRAPDEYPTLGTKYSIAESLQLVHYSHAQEYTAHHDFGFGRIDDQYQGARFATILFYLNDGMTGGETSFPRWVNAETFKDLKVKPEKGKAVLFYSQLPDGNFDDFSQHAAKPIIDGEKLTNLWVWEPIYE